ncbi:MAG: hypothetical protein GY847_28855 [Proteobacteria bacterium]|nr:hypothetical protein [Pseudomonadota bacterium]
MSNLELIKSLVGMGTTIHYVPHNITHTNIMYGAPPVSLTGFDSVAAWRNVPSKKRIGSLTGKGLFVTNNNKSGVIEITFLDSTIACVAIEAAGMIGIPFPIIITDSSTKLALVAGMSCSLVETPQWRRALTPDRVVYHFEATDLTISHGVRDTM